MANLVVSDACDLHCRYCFAGDSMVQGRAAFLPLEDFDRRLDFLERSGIDEARLIGGEPTLHPEFPAILDRAVRRGKKIVLFTHGLFRDRVLEALCAIPPKQCLVLVNMNAVHDDETAAARDSERKIHVLTGLGERAMPGYTICSPNPPLESLLETIRRTGCRKTVRIGLAHPQVSGSNAYLHPKQYPLVGRPLASFAERAAGDGVRVDFDCGFVRCMFEPQDLEKLRRTQTDLDFRCNPILDIDRAGNALHCFPLARAGRVTLSDGSTAAELRSALEAEFRGYRRAGVYRECSACKARARGECSGGCLAATLRRFQPAPV